MRSEDVREFVFHRPFRPFRVTLTDGRTYDVHHPELAMVGYSTVIVGLPRPTEPSPIYDRAVTISLPHITRIEPLETPSSQDPSSSG